ncbi:hypothetical protein Aglo01_02760 [Actinokineospora globicatena]|nr:hypothetical protein Aglo01_02760 [Actinokineospora globicatena]
MARSAVSVSSDSLGGGMAPIGWACPTWPGCSTGGWGRLATVSPARVSTATAALNHALALALVATGKS